MTSVKLFDEKYPAYELNIEGVVYWFIILKDKLILTKEA